MSSPAAGAVRDRGVDGPVCRIAGYLLFGEPTYITGFRGARQLIGRVERHEIWQELVRACFADGEQCRAEPGD